MSSRTQISGLRPRTDTVASPIFLFSIPQSPPQFHCFPDWPNLIIPLPSLHSVWPFRFTFVNLQPTRRGQCLGEVFSKLSLERGSEDNRESIDGIKVQSRDLSRDSEYLSKEGVDLFEE